MNRFIITDEVNTKLIQPEDVLCVGSSSALETAKGYLPWMTFPEMLLSASVAAVRALRDKAITKITTVEQLRLYKNCVSDEWKTKVVYIEHPHRNGVLIESSLYKDYILREMVSDISNYIMNHLDLSKMVIGQVVSGKGYAKVKVPVNQLNAEATIECSLNKNYVFSVSDTHVIPSDEEKYVWINQFPDIISAVKHCSRTMEMCKSVALALDVGLGYGPATVNAGAKKNYDFYISYTKA